jgi:hypothetical protein
MQQSRQKGEAGAVVFALAGVAFILKVDSLVQRLLRPQRAQRGQRMQMLCQLIHLQRLQRGQRSSQLRLHRVAAPHVHELR